MKEVKKSTAEGAKKASECSDHSATAIASTQAAKVYALDVLAENIQQNTDNVTRFYVVSDGEPSLEASDCTTFTAIGSASALPYMLKELDAQGMALVSIHDRPAKTTPGQYVYVVECAAADRMPAKKLQKNVRILLSVIWVATLY